MMMIKSENTNKQKSHPKNSDDNFLVHDEHRAVLKSKMATS